MSRQIPKMMLAVGLLAATLDCFAMNEPPLVPSDLQGRTAYLSDFEICSDGTLLFEFSFTPEEICDGGTPAVCNSQAPAWYYIPPADVSATQYLRFVSTAATAETGQIHISSIHATDVTNFSKACNGMTVTVKAELTDFGVN